MPLQAAPRALRQRRLPPRLGYFWFALLKNRRLSEEVHLATQLADFALLNFGEGGLLALGEKAVPDFTGESMFSWTSHTPRH
jgi:hypothetical protein